MFGGEEVRQVVEERMIENPMATEGLVRPAVEAGNSEARWVPGQVNLVTLRGALAKVKGLGRDEMAAAERLKLLFDAMQPGGGAIDYAEAKVDVSASSADPLANKLDAAREFRRAGVAVGPFEFKLLVDVVCWGRTVGRAGGEGTGGAAMLRTKRRLKEGLAKLAAHFAKRRGGIRREGAVAGDWSASGGEAPAVA